MSHGVENVIDPNAVGDGRGSLRITGTVRPFPRVPSSELWQIAIRMRPLPSRTALHRGFTMSGEEALPAPSPDVPRSPALASGRPGQCLRGERSDLRRGRSSIGPVREDPSARHLSSIAYSQSPKESSSMMNPPRSTYSRSPLRPRLVQPPRSWIFRVNPRIVEEFVAIGIHNILKSIAASITRHGYFTSLTNCRSALG